jgi:hypothetical protein
MHLMAAMATYAFAYASYPRLVHNMNLLATMMAHVLAYAAVLTRSFS